MTGVLDAAALLVTAAGLGAAAVVLASTRQPRAALPVLLDLLTGAGLLGLAADPGWRRLLSAAAIIALRHLILLGLHPSQQRPTVRPDRVGGPGDP